MKHAARCCETSGELARLGPGTAALGLNGLTPAIAAPDRGPPLPHFRRDWAHPCHIHPRTGRIPPTSAPGPGAPVATSAPGLGSPLPHLRRDRACPSHICAGTMVGTATSKARCSHSSRTPSARNGARSSSGARCVPLCAGSFRAPCVCLLWRMLAVPPGSCAVLSATRFVGSGKSRDADAA